MKKKQSHTDFLKAVGAAANTIRSINWSKHSLGPPEDWPSSLKISLNLILRSDLPMHLFWGADYICFYNDAFIRSLLSQNKHPGAMGNKADKIWSENWASLSSHIEQVLRDDTEITYEDYLFPLFHNSISLIPIKDEMGNSSGVLAICKETFSTIVAERELKELYEEKNRILENITDGFYTVNEEWIVTHWNPEAEKLMGVNQDDILGKNLWNIFPEGKQWQFYPEYQKVMKERIPTSFEEYYEPWGKWFNFNVYPSKEGISVYFQDITRERRLQLINERTEEISGVAGWDLDLATQNVFMTPKAYDIYGLKKNTPIDLEVNKKLYDERSLKKIEEAVHSAIDQRQPYEIELNLIKKQDDKRVIRINGYPLVKDGKVTKLYGTLEDVTEEKKQKKELQEAIRKLKTAQKIGKIGYWTTDLFTNTSEWSAEVCEIYEVDPDTFDPSFENWLALVHPADRKEIQLDLESIFVGDREYYDLEHRIITPTGCTKWIHARITLHRSEKGEPEIIEGISQDITEGKEQEQQILQALQEKEILLEEVHHRVKNNLAVISSMVQLQAFEETNSEVRDKLMDSVVRILSMASIHEQLYQSHSFSKLDLSKSLSKLITKIVETLDYDINITLDFDLEPVELNINQAIPCSLIVNEVITNVIKHAFYGKSEGTISTALKEKNNCVSLEIKDNGIGMSVDIEIKDGKTLGLRLIETLAKQLHASYQYHSPNEGTTFSIQFEKSEVKGSGSANIYK